MLKIEKKKTIAYQPGRFLNISKCSLYFFSILFITHYRCKRASTVSIGQKQTGALRHSEITQTYVASQNFCFNSTFLDKNFKA